jgi:hypothetical protein
VLKGSNPTSSFAKNPTFGTIIEPTTPTSEVTVTLYGNDGKAEDITVTFDETWDILQRYGVDLKGFKDGW